MKAGSSFYSWDELHLLRIYYGLFILLTWYFILQKLLILMKSSLSMISFMDHACGTQCKKKLLQTESFSISYHYLIEVLWFYLLKLRSVVHLFFLFFLWIMLKFCLEIFVVPSPHPEETAFSPWVTSVPVSKSSWLGLSNYFSGLRGVLSTNVSLLS